MAGAPYIALGFVSILLQITVLREFLTVFSGNELDIGITLSLWLLFTGAGSISGSRIKFKNAFSYSFLIVAVFSALTLAGIGLIRPALGLELGEAASLSGTFLSTAAILFPICFSLGLQFPLAVSDIGGKHPASRIYGLEAAGAFLGGLLFTFVLSGRTEPQHLVFALCFMCIALSAYLLKKPIVLLSAIIPLVIYAASYMEGKSRTGGMILEKVQSRYGEVMMTRLGSQFNLYSSGHYLYTYPDPKVDEQSVHLVMPVHSHPEYVLSIGGSPARLKEYLKYPIKRVDFIEIDPAIVRLSLKMLGAEAQRLIDDKRARVIVKDGRQFMKSVKAQEYDVIALNLSAPSTANMNRFYTVQFFKEAKASLKKGGIISVMLPASSGYVGKRMKLANGSIFNSLKSVFKYAATSSEEYGLIIASDSVIDTSPKTLAGRYMEAAPPVVHFSEHVIEDAFSHVRADAYKKRLDEVREINTDSRPVAFLYNLMLWAEVHGARLLNEALGLKGYNAIIVLAGFAAGAATVYKKRKKTLYYSTLTSGYAAMSFVIAILLAYQSRFGYLYEMFGLISAVFMAGVAVGSYYFRRSGIRELIFLEFGAAALAASFMLFTGIEIMFYAISLASGIITGGQFASVNEILGSKEQGQAGGMVYALDLAGSFIGAVLTAIILIPLLGVKESLFMAGGIKIISGFCVLMIRNE